MRAHCRPTSETLLLELACARGGRPQVSRLTAYELRVSGHEGYKKAEVTGGGVRLEEVECATLESKVSSAGLPTSPVASFGSLQAVSMAVCAPVGRCVW